ncbi:MAG: C1 family peptidase [Saprospiraceae bacterium]
MSAKKNHTVYFWLIMPAYICTKTTFKQVLIFFLFLCFLVSTAQSQSYPTGLLLDDEDYESQTFTSTNIQFDGSKALTRRVDLEPYCPEVRHQGEISSCVGWSSGYAALTIERAIANGWTNKQQITENANSALFVFNQVQKIDCDNGIVISKALQVLQERGNCLAREFDFDVNDCSREASQTHFSSARQYQISDYIPLFKPDAPVEEKTQMLKRVLAQNKPVIVGMRILQNFLTIQEGDDNWWPTIGNKTPAGGHAMVVIGFDDDKFKSPNPDPNMAGAFKLMNSWGKNWGDRGFIWVRYAHFAEYCRYAFAIMLKNGEPINLEEDPESLTVDTEQPTTQSNPNITSENPNLATTTSRKLLSLSGSFGFQQFTGEWYNNKPVFEEAKVQLNNGYYTLEGTPKTGDKFQLYAKNGFDNGYIYVFSVDAVGKTEVHFPKTQANNVKIQSRESAMVMSGGAQLNIPGGNRVLTLTQPGDDYLVVLFSTQKITQDIQVFCDMLLSDTHALVQSIYDKLGEWMVTPTDVTYAKKEMGFEVSTRSDGKIVPLILKVNVSE